MARSLDPEMMAQSVRRLAAVANRLGPNDKMPAALLRLQAQSLAEMLGENDSNELARWASRLAEELEPTPADMAASA
jgi:hypothetical protein